MRPGIIHLIQTSMSCNHDCIVSKENTRIILSSLTHQSPTLRRAKSPGKKAVVRFVIQLRSSQCTKDD